MGVLLPNYLQEIVVKGDNVPHFSKMNGGKTGNDTLNGTSIGTFNGISCQHREWYSKGYTEQCSRY